MLETVAKAVTAPGWVRILKRLEGVELSVCQITARFGARHDIQTCNRCLCRRGLGRQVHWDGEA